MDSSLIVADNHRVQGIVVFESVVTFAMLRWLQTKYNESPVHEPNTLGKSIAIPFPFRYSFPFASVWPRNCIAFK
ncbi:hypothetical protein RvY_18806 [Ramazzottius varieornatus]|uniref:Uncharacterized protein n=1 Tax=Ramazzottius varieornatus TaxID=947166 RepID=A0A1D1W756_RAMVA|nr:hypothetical protein RvY_18806 [Ramazzottius varieornatus]